MIRFHYVRCYPMNGRDLAPRVAARLHTGLCADCTALDVTDDKLVAWTRPALGGNICATIICDVNRPQMGTVRPKVFKPAEMDNNRTGEVIAFTPEAGAVSRVELVKKEALSSENAVKIDEADMIAAGGRGFGSKENFDVLEQLAALFENSAVAGTRAAIDEGWLTHSQQVGQSGKSVTPHIYFACGISGAIQHLSGMKDSDIIIAINKDAEAPIFTVAHYGIVGDVEVILPLLSEALDTGEKKPAPPMVKMRRPFFKKSAPEYKRYVCLGCGHEYDQAYGDPEGGIDPGTPFNKLPEDWICPKCGEGKEKLYRRGVGVIYV